MTPTVSPASPGMSQRNRFILGVLVLLSVVVIWVLSSELTRYIFVHDKFDKPFFTTYFKTSMFTVYLSGFLLLTSWRQQCHSGQAGEGYERVPDAGDSSDDADDALLGDPEFVPTQFDSSSETESVSNLPAACEAAEEVECSINTSVEQEQLQGRLYDELADDSAVGGEEESPAAYRPSRSRSVRFARVSEVRQLSDSQAVAASLARLSYPAYKRARATPAPNTQAPTGPLPVMSVAKLALLFCLLWFLGNWSYQFALKMTTAGTVNVLSSTSSLFTLILAAVFPSESRDRFTLTKLVAVVLCIAGVALVSDLENAFSKRHVVPWGSIWALIGSLAYACYLVLLKRQVRNENAMPLPMFFGFVGLFNCILLWPGFFVVHYTGLEPFALPNKTDWIFISINGSVGTALSELLWLWGCFLTTSLLATLALSLCIPFTALADYLIYKTVYKWTFFLGSSLIFCSFVVVALVAHFNDNDVVLRALLACRDFLAGGSVPGPVSSSSSSSTSTRVRSRAPRGRRIPAAAVLAASKDVRPPEVVPEELETSDESPLLGAQQRLDSINS